MKQKQKEWNANVVIRKLWGGGGAVKFGGQINLLENVQTKKIFETQLQSPGIS